MPRGACLDATCSHSGGKVRSTEAVGFVDDDRFELTITWDNGTKGRYNGRLESAVFVPADQGVFKGTTVDVFHPSSSAGWESNSPSDARVTACSQRS